MVSGLNDLLLLHGMGEKDNISRQKTREKDKTRQDRLIETGIVSAWLKTALVLSTTQGHRDLCYRYKMKEKYFKKEWTHNNEN